MDDLDDPGVTPVPTGRPVRFDLTWDRRSDEPPVDVDLGCFYWADERTRGAVQAVGSRDSSAAGGRAGDRGDLFSLSSDRTDGGPDGERLTLQRPGRISFLVVHASIYDGAVDFRDVGARIAVRSGRRRLAEVTLAAPAPGLDWCAVLVLGRSGSQLYLAREERYFRSAFHADRHYGLGLDWGIGYKGPPESNGEG